MAYTIRDAQFDAEALGKCPICFQFPSDCGHCSRCGKGECQEENCCFLPINTSFVPVSMYLYDDQGKRYNNPDHPRWKRE